MAAGPAVPSWLSVARGRAVHTRHGLAVPLMYAQEVVGVLALACVRDVPFGPDDLAAVGTIATVAALALRNARQFASVEEVSRAKSLFLNMAAHELRTPLSVERGYASMLRDGTLGELSGECTGAVATLQSKSDELAHLVEGLLMASRLEAGRAQPRREEVDAKRTVIAMHIRPRKPEDLASCVELLAAVHAADGYPALLLADPNAGRLPAACSAPGWPGGRTDFPGTSA